MSNIRKTNNSTPMDVCMRYYGDVSYLIDLCNYLGLQYSDIQNATTLNIDTQLNTPSTQLLSNEPLCETYTPNHFLYSGTTGSLNLIGWYSNQRMLPFASGKTNSGYSYLLFENSGDTTFSGITIYYYTSSYDNMVTTGAFTGPIADLPGKTSKLYEIPLRENGGIIWNNIHVEELLIDADGHFWSPIFKDCQYTIALNPSYTGVTNNTGFTNSSQTFTNTLTFDNPYGKLLDYIRTDETCNFNATQTITGYTTPLINYLYAGNNFTITNQPKGNTLTGTSAALSWYVYANDLSNIKNGQKLLLTIDSLTMLSGNSVNFYFEDSGYNVVSNTTTALKVTGATYTWSGLSYTMTFTHSAATARLYIDGNGSKIPTTLQINNLNVYTTGSTSTTITGSTYQTQYTRLASSGVTVLYSIPMTTFSGSTYQSGNAKVLTGIYMNPPFNVPSNKIEGNLYWNF